MVALGIVTPVLPKLIIEFEQGDMARAAMLVGVFATLWAAMQFVFSPVIGSLSDRFGRRKTILLSNFGLGLDYFLMAWAPTLGWLFVGRVISGITSASYATAFAYIADVTPPRERAGRFGLLGRRVRPGLRHRSRGGRHARRHRPAPAVLDRGRAQHRECRLRLFHPPRIAAPGKSPRLRLAAREPVGSLILLRSHPELFGFAVALFVMYIAHESLPNLFVLYTDYLFRWDPATVGFALAAVGVSSTLVSAGLVRPAVARFGERRTLTAGLLFGVVGFLLFAVAWHPAVLILGIGFVSLWGLAGPSLQGLMSRRVGPTEQGQLQGAMSGIRGITGMIGPFLFTQVFATAIGLTGMRLAGIPYAVAAALLLVALAIAMRVRRLHGNAAPSADGAPL